MDNETTEIFIASGGHVQRASLRNILRHLTPVTIATMARELTVAVNADWLDPVKSTPGPDVVAVRDALSHYLCQQWPEYAIANAEALT